MHTDRTPVVRKVKAAARKDHSRPAAATSVGHQILQLLKPTAETPPPPKKRAAALLPAIH
jgi:hypothetical protein